MHPRARVACSWQKEKVWTMPDLTTGIAAGFSSACGISGGAALMRSSVVTADDVDTLESAPGGHA